MDVTFDADGWWPYTLVFIAAATPVIEVLVVIPTAMVAGMPPVPTTVLALAGNLSTVILAVAVGDRFAVWWRSRRPQRSNRPGRRAQRARRLAQRWGVPVLGLLAPVSTGTHIAALAALATGASRARVLRWMATGLVAWAVLAAAATASGLHAFT